MKDYSPRWKKIFTLALASALALTNQAPFVNSDVFAQGRILTKDEQKAVARGIEKQQRVANEFDNGIFVGEPKVYDDSALQLMLNAARARLATIQAFDQAGLLARIGAVTGASLSQSGFSAQVLSAPIPQIATTALGATGSTSTTTNATGTSTTTQAGLPVENTVTTNPQMLAAAPGLPQSSLALPSAGFSVSSLDALNEQMQLTYEIANLQLLLEGSLNDRYVKGQRFVKPRTTLGFPITITPQSAYKNAVAVVEVEVLNPPAEVLSEEEPPAVTALLPREKTYNVAALTDRMTSIGGGLVTQVINGGFSWFSGRKSYYIVQDQDTIAIMRPSSDKAKATAFSWEFRPVLGQPFVRAGMKQTFVQIASPIRNGLNCFGQLRVRTYWRRMDRKTGVLKDVIAQSVSDLQPPRPIPNFDLTPVFRNVSYDDLGAGNIRVTVEGNFLTGTYVRVGNNYYREGSPGFTSELTKIRFVAAAADVAKYNAYIVSRDGSETQITSAGNPNESSLINAGCPGMPAGQQTWFGADSKPAGPIKPRTLAVNVSAFDDSRSIVKAVLTNLPETRASDDQYVMIINDRVFGLADAPIERAPHYDRAGNSVKNALELRAIVPNSLINAAKEVGVKPLLWRKDTHAFTAALKTSGIENSGERIVVMTQSDTGTTFLLYGSRLSETSIKYPSDVKLVPFPGGDDSTIRRFFLTKEQVGSLKQIVLQKADTERPVFVSLPDPAAKPVLTVGGRVTVGTDELVVTGDVFDQLKSVKFNRKVINKLPGESSKSVRLIGLVGSGVTSSAGKPELQFEFEDGRKNTLKLDVVNSKIETVDRDKP